MRSLKASGNGIQKASQALSQNAWTKVELAHKLGVARSTIIRFFSGQAISSESFISLCKILNLDWQEVVESELSEAFLPENIQDKDVAKLVQKIREQVKSDIQERCGTMRVLDMTQPIELTGDRGIYTHVNTLEKITGLRRLEISELLEHDDQEEFDRFELNRITEKRILGLEAVKNHRKLMVLGKPGAGKTTFLKYLALHCIAGEFLANCVPIFVTLKDFAEASKQPDLLDYLRRALPDPNVSLLQDLLQAGRLLILLDGLDEVREEDTRQVIQQIREVSDQFAHNQFVITCRIAAKEYTFERFTEVEVADFDKAQIADFAQKWFQAKGDGERATLFSQKLEQHEPIQELATNPLLLTLLCLVFESATDFPANRSELYKEGLDILLKKWDGSRKIERDQVYQKLSLKRKEDLLSQIALTTFTDKEYFIKQKHLEAQISDYIGNLPDAKTDPAALHLDSEAVLKSITAQHGLLVERAKGIYSFSHLTFHEYFAAREIVSNPGTTSIHQLVEHLTEKRWREVFFVTAGMMRNADELMLEMKQKIDELLKVDKMLQQFLTWVQHKSITVDVTYKASAVRAYYLALVRSFSLTRTLDHELNRTRALELDLDLARNLDVDLVSNFAQTSNIELAIARELSRVLALALTIAPDLALTDAHALTLTFARDLALTLAQDSELQCQIQQLRDQLPNEENREMFRQWWQANGSAWTEQLRAVMIEHRDIGHDWQFSDAQKQLLQQYSDANLLLVQCLNSDCYVSREVRAEIEATLLLPTATFGDGRSAPQDLGGF